MDANAVRVGHVRRGSRERAGKRGAEGIPHPARLTMHSQVVTCALVHVTWEHLARYHVVSTTLIR